MCLSKIHSTCLTNKEKKKQTHNNEFSDLLMRFLENKDYQDECHRDTQEDASRDANSTIMSVTPVLNLNWIHSAPIQKTSRYVKRGRHWTVVAAEPLSR